MKMMIVLASLFVMPAAFAADCPADSELKTLCVPAPVKDDSVFAAEAFDSVSVCVGVKQNYLILEKSGQSEAVPAATINRMGGTTFAVVAQGVETTLDLVTGILRTEGIPATLTITMTAAKLPPASATYSCKMN